MWEERNSLNDVTSKQFSRDTVTHLDSLRWDTRNQLNF